MTILETGLSSVDEVFKDPTNKLIFINGEDKQGKTALALQIAINLRHTRKVVKYFSLELEATDLSLRALANATPFNIATIKTEKLSNEKLVQAMADLCKAKMYIDDNKDYSIKELTAWIEKEQQSNPAALIIIDQLELIKDSAGLLDENLFEIAYGLSELSKTLSCPLLVINSFSLKNLPNEGKDIFYTPRIPFVANVTLETEIKKDRILATHRGPSHQFIKTYSHAWNKESLRIDAL